jgi:hypothetical protein
MPQWALLLLGSIVGIGFVAGVLYASFRREDRRRGLRPRLDEPSAWGGLDGATAGHLMSTSGDTSSGNGADGGGSH